MSTYVIGAGVTGLAFAKTFGDNAKILEFKDDLGGRALSYKIETKIGEFGFDIGGHWFHHKNAPEALELLKGLEVESHKRNAYVFLDNQFFEFPIQQGYKNHSNLNFVKSVKGELDAIQREKESHLNYDDMLQKSYGPTLYEAFFKNYNIKMYGVEDLSKINIGYYEKIRNVRIDNDIKGYNSDFVYPKGDIGAKGIPLFLAENLKVNFNKRVESIYLSTKSMKVNGENIAWENIISTMPLKSVFGKFNYRY